MPPGRGLLSRRQAVMGSLRPLLRPDARGQIDACGRRGCSFAVAGSLAASGDLDGLQGWRACGSLLSGDRSLRRRRSSAGRRLDALPAGEIPGAHARDAIARDDGIPDQKIRAAT